MPGLLRAGELGPGCGSQSTEVVASWSWSPRAAPRRGWAGQGESRAQPGVPVALWGRGLAGPCSIQRSRCPWAWCPIATSL